MGDTTITIKFGPNVKGISRDRIVQSSVNSSGKPVILHDVSQAAGRRVPCPRLQLRPPQQYRPTRTSETPSQNLLYPAPLPMARPQTNLHFIVTNDTTTGWMKTLESWSINFLGATAYAITVCTTFSCLLTHWSNNLKWARSLSETRLTRIPPILQIHLIHCYVQCVAPSTWSAYR